MASAAISRQLRTKHRPIRNPSLLPFFSSSTSSYSAHVNIPSPSPLPPPQSLFSSHFSDVKAGLKQNPPPRRQQRQHRNPLPLPSAKPHNGRPSLDAIRESVHQLLSDNDANTTNEFNKKNPISLELKMRPVDPNNARASRLVFVRTYGYEELGEKLRRLRPEGKKGEDWFSLGELNERLVKLREVEEKESRVAGFSFRDLKMKLRNSSEGKTKIQTRSLSYFRRPRGATTEKHSWPELVGLESEEAKEIIQREMPEAQIQVVPPPGFCTFELNTGRVRVYVNSSGKVIDTPTIG